MLRPRSPSSIGEPWGSSHSVPPRYHVPRKAFSATFPHRHCSSWRGGGSISEGGAFAAAVPRIFDGATWVCHRGCRRHSRLRLCCRENNPNHRRRHRHPCHSSSSPGIRPRIRRGDRRLHRQHLPHRDDAVSSPLRRENFSLRHPRRWDDRRNGYWNWK